MRFFIVTTAIVLATTASAHAGTQMRTAGDRAAPAPTTPREFATPAAVPSANPAEQVGSAMAIGDNLEAQGNLQGALSVYKEIVTRPEAPPEASVRLASLYRLNGDNEDAVNTLRDAARRHPGDEKTLSRIGFALVKAGQPEEAVSLFDQLIAMDPENPSYYNGKAVAFDTAGNHIAAQEIYEKAVTLAPNAIAIKNNLALSYILNDQPSEAIALLEPLIGQPEATPTIRQNLALAYGLKGDRKQAINVSKMDITPEHAAENARFYEKYAELRKRAKKSELAGRMQTELSDVAPSQPVTLMPVNEQREVVKGAVAHPAPAATKALVKKAPEPVKAEPVKAEAPPPAPEPVKTEAAKVEPTPEAIKAEPSAGPAPEAVKKEPPPVVEAPAKAEKPPLPEPVEKAPEPAAAPEEEKSMEISAPPEIKEDSGEHKAEEPVLEKTPDADLPAFPTVRP